MKLAFCMIVWQCYRVQCVLFAFEFVDIKIPFTVLPNNASN